MDMIFSLLYLIRRSSKSFNFRNWFFLLITTLSSWLCTICFHMLIISVLHYIESKANYYRWWWRIIYSQFWKSSTPLKMFNVIWALLMHLINSWKYDQFLFFQRSLCFWFWSCYIKYQKYNKYMTRKQS